MARYIRLEAFGGKLKSENIAVVDFPPVYSLAVFDDTKTFSFDSPDEFKIKKANFWHRGKLDKMIWIYEFKNMV